MADEKAKISNEHYQSLLFTYLNKLSEKRLEICRLARRVIGSTLVEDDFYYASLTDRSIRLLDGFSQMIETRNLTCAGALLRLQIDNCLRGYAGFICEDKDAFIRGFIEGKRVKDFKDNNGKKMTDAVLKQRLAELYPKVPEAYDISSGFVHFSYEACRAIARAEEDYTITINIGHELDEKANRLLLECAEAFIYFVDIQGKILSEYAKWKSTIE